MRFHKFFATRGLSVFPATAAKLDLFVNMINANSKSIAKDALVAINHVERINGKMAHPYSWIKTKAARGITRRLTQPRKQAAPFAVAFAIKAYDQIVLRQLYQHKPVNDHWLHIATVVLIMSATWARYNCMSHFNLRLSLASVGPKIFSCIFDRRKFRDHQCRVPLRNGLSGHNPLIALKRWKSRFGMHRAPKLRKHIFLRKICFRSKPPKVLNALMPCGQLTQIIRLVATRINMPASQFFTSHSPRVGGNSTAANTGIPIEIRQHFGMWRQPSSAQDYDAQINGSATLTSVPFQ